MAVDYATLKKGGFMRQKQKNNFSLRLRTVGGHMSAEQLAKVAEVAEKYGEGYVHLTSRQGVETVSYTHLDVYKRQLLLHMIIYHYIVAIYHFSLLDAIPSKQAVVF